MNQSGPETVLVHAPYGKDAIIICQVLERGGIHASICSTVEGLCAELGENTGAALISDESLTRPNVLALAAIVHAQPPWSDLPLIVTTSGGEATALSRSKLELLEPLGNIALLERPLRTATLLSAFRIALRARERQYQLRENFAERERLVRELERSNDELGNFAHIVSHDLQAPIRMMSAFSGLLAKRYAGKLDKDADGFLTAIQNGAASMEELVRTLLQYATAGQEAMTREELDLNAVAGDVVATFQPSLDAMKANVSYDDLPRVFGDRLLLRQVIQNLVGNALKYCQPGTPVSIRISSKRSGNEYRISVQDNGPGIDSVSHERIFQPLKRLHGNDIPGTGMGLAVCRKIIERHGGRIWVESVVGEGSTFTFSIPTRAGADSTVKQAAQRSGVPF